MDTHNEKISKWLLFTLCFIVMLGPMNAVIFNVALSDISNDLSVSPSKASWVVVGYSLVVGIGSMVYGKFADRYSVKKLLIIAILLFILGSLVGFIYRTYEFVILARLLQASGGAAFIALGMIAVTKIYPAEEKSGALAMISSSIALAVGIGPLAGGAITNTLGWPYLFIFMVISIFGIFLLLKFMPKEKANRANEPFHFDVIGAILLFGLITSFLLGVNINGWLFVISLLLLFLFRFRMIKAKHPFIDLDLFKNKTFLCLMAVGFIINVALCANLILLPLLLSSKHDLSPFTIGIFIFVSSLFGILSSFMTGRIVPNIGNIKMIHISSLIMIIGFLLLGLFPNANLIIIVLSSILTFMSYSAIQVSLNTFLPKILNPAKIGVALGLYNLINFVGMAFGPAAASKIMESTNSFSLNFNLIAIIISLHFILLIRISSLQSKTA